jgi:hypothetical protein
MSAISDAITAIDQELGEVESQMRDLEVREGQLRTARDTLTELEGGGMTETRTPPRPKPRQKPRRPRVARKAPASEPSAGVSSHPDDASLSPDAEAIVNVLKARRGEWLRRADIQRAAELTEPRYQAAMAKLKRVNRVRMAGQRAGARYVLAEDDAPEPELGSESPGASERRKQAAAAPATTVDQNGARTQVERDVVASIGSIQLTTFEIAANADIPEGQVREVVAGLVRRGVLEREDYGGKSVYGVATA